MKILVATDGSKCSERAVKFASKIASESRSMITLVYIMPKLPPTKEELVKLLRKQLGNEKETGSKYLQKGEKIAEKLNAKTETKLLEGNPAEEILKEAKKGSYDLSKIPVLVVK